MDILGISTGARGSAAVLVRDGQPVAAAREEWFSRVPLDPAPPRQAAAFCLESVAPDGPSPEVVARTGRPEGRLSALSTWLGALAGAKTPELSPPLLTHLRRLRAEAETRTVPDARAAAASAFYPSPFEEAAILVANGSGPAPGCLLGRGEGTRLRVLAETPTPHGPGALYAVLAARLGRRYPYDEPGLIDLARLGKPRFVEAIRRERFEFTGDGLFRLHPSRGAGDSDLLGEASEPGRGPFSQQDMDLAQSVQTVLQEALLHAARRLRRDTGLTRLVFAGDTALNPAAAARLVREGPFDEVWIPPSPADTALGAALDTWYRLSASARTPRPVSPYLGPVYSVPALESYLNEWRIAHEQLDTDRLVEHVATALARGYTVGWFQGPASASSEGLGARAILADPRSGALRDLLNARTKRRSPFRTFTACVLAERVGEFLDWHGAGPHVPLSAPMLRERAQPARRKGARGRGNERPERPSLAAVLQPDGGITVRPIERRVDPLLHRLLRAFAARTGCPMLLCTPLSAESEPLAVTPRDAYTLFMRVELDYLALGPFLLDKRQQPLWEDAGARA